MATLENITFRTVVQSFVIAVMLILLIGYVIFQSRFLLLGPQVVLKTEHPTHTNQRTVTLHGEAYNITHLWLNDRPIFTNADGQFKEALILENGYTIATLRAVDRYGRTTKVTRSFVYTPASLLYN